MMNFGTNYHTIWKNMNSAGSDSQFLVDPQSRILSPDSLNALAVPPFEPTQKSNSTSVTSITFIQH